jgi:hypothetical protein
MVLTLLLKMNKTLSSQVVSFYSTALRALKSYLTALRILITNPLFYYVGKRGIFFLNMKHFIILKVSIFKRYHSTAALPHCRIAHFLIHFFREPGDCEFFNYRD